MRQTNGPRQRQNSGVLWACGETAPAGLAEAIVARGPAVVPMLRRILEWREGWYFDDDDPTAGWAPIHAMFLVGMIGDPSAVSSLLLPLTWDDDYPDEYLNDGSGIFARLGPQALPELQAFVREDDNEFFARWTVFDGIRGMGLLFPECANAATDLARELTRRAHEGGPSVPTFAVDALAVRGSEEDLALLRATFESDDWECEGDYEWEDVERAFSRHSPTEYDIYQFIRDPMEHFHPDPHLRGVHWISSAPDPPRAASLPKPPAPSRNAPCPCGSGRKYKRCCGR